MTDHLEHGQPETEEEMPLSERQFRLIVEGLEIEYTGKPHALINICADTRFKTAKIRLKEELGDGKATDILHKIF